MNVLALETSGSAEGGIAACRDGECLAEQRFDRGMAHGRMLVSLLDRCLADAGWDKRRDVELIAVGIGPGSYTGLRVGLTCAKTLAALLQKPIVGVCSFDAMCRNAPADAPRVLVALDAKRGQVYAAGYERSGEEFVRLFGPLLATPEEARDRMARPFAAMGDALTRYADALAGDGIQPLPPSPFWQARPAVTAQLALARFRRGESDDPVQIEPIYLRLAEAEEKRLAREKGGA